MYDLPQAFRDAMARVPAPVTIITASVSDVAYGTTVSAFASLSLTPPMVFFALDGRGRMVERLRLTRRFGVNVLASDQAGLAERFAARTADRFDRVAWADDSGLPKLAHTASWLRCEVVAIEPGGDHSIVLGRVAGAENYRTDALSYHLRTFVPMGLPG
ncbi:MAG: flavin reductase family protein [Arachnia sp.]